MNAWAHHPFIPSLLYLTAKHLSKKFRAISFQWNNKWISEVPRQWNKVSNTQLGRSQLNLLLHSHMSQLLAQLQLWWKKRLVTSGRDCGLLCWTAMNFRYHTVIAVCECVLILHLFWSFLYLCMNLLSLYSCYSALFFVSKDFLTATFI